MFLADVTPPEFQGCFQNELVVDRLDPPNYTIPNVTDNSNGAPGKAIRTFTIQPAYFSPVMPLTGSVNVTYTAEDYEGNTNSCTIRIRLRGECYRFFER